MDRNISKLFRKFLQLESRECHDNRRIVTARRQYVQRLRLLGQLLEVDYHPLGRDLTKP